MAKKRVRKILREGERTTFYLKKGFPQEMLDWINGQSDMQLLFDYALDRLYQEEGPVDVASVLPRTYEIGQGIKSVNNHVIADKKIEDNITEDTTEMLVMTNKETSSSFSDNIEEKENQTDIISDKETEKPLNNKSLETESTFDEPTEVNEINTANTEDKEQKFNAPKKSSWGGLSDFDDSGYM